MIKGSFTRRVFDACSYGRKFPISEETQLSDAAARLSRNLSERALTDRLTNPGFHRMILSVSGRHEDALMYVRQSLEVGVPIRQDRMPVGRSIDPDVDHAFIVNL